MDTVPDKCRQGERVCEYNNYRKCGKDFCVLPRCIKEGGVENGGGSG